MKRPAPIIVAPLFPELEARLLEVLRSLSAEEWAAPTACAGWSVKDVAAHLLDTALRRLSMARDGYFAAAPAPDKLVEFINRANAEWVGAARRLSPDILVEMLQIYGRQLGEYLQTLDPNAPAAFAVSWAGEETSANWFDIAREYTERWHHQQQIREATGRPGIDTPELLAPVIDTFMRALPYAYRDVPANEDALLKVEVIGPAGGSWFLLRAQRRWELWLEREEKAVAVVTVPEEVAWKLPTKGLSKAQAGRMIRCEGDPDLGSGVLEMLCIVG